MTRAKHIYGFALLVAAVFVSCFDKVESVKTPDAAVVPRYADWGAFVPGAGTAHGQGDETRAFGAPDGDMLHLGSGGVLTVSFGDNLIYDAVGAEFTIHGRWDSTEEVTVFGSEDGANFRVIGTATASDPSVEITEGGFDFVIYLQIQDSGGGDGAEIDAVEVLNVP